MNDSYIHKGQRQRLVDQIKRKGISDEKVLAAIDKIPRHLFIESYLWKRAYIDEALPIGAGQTISQPYTVAFQTELLKLKKGDKVLEVGTGSGYQTAVLLELGAKVYTIERQKQLYNNTNHILAKLNYHPYTFYGDGYEGLPNYGPFDKILVTAGAPEIPKKLLQQLKPEGIIVVPVGDSFNQVMTSIKRISDKEFKKITHGDFIFVPMLKGIAK